MSLNHCSDGPLSLSDAVFHSLDLHEGHTHPFATVAGGDFFIKFFSVLLSGVHIL